MKDYLITDSFKFTIPEDKNLRDSLIAGMSEIKDHQGAPALEVILDATHGGYVNSNYTHYRKDGMQKAATTWFTPYPKPVLVEHDDSLSPIGRIVDAQFVDIPVDNSQMAANGQMGRPTGKITLKAVITDMESIQKILDGRFMTVSISGRPKGTPTCSICNGTVDGPFGCEDGHMRGKSYDGKLAFYFVDEMVYSEVSFVNKPADQSDTHVAAVTSIKAVEAPALSQGAKEAMEEALQKFSKDKKKEPVAVADSAAAPAAVTPAPVETPAPAAEVPAAVAPVAAPAAAAPAASDAAAAAPAAEPAAAAKPTEPNKDMELSQLHSAIATLTEANKTINKEMGTLIEQKKQAEAKMAEATTKIDQLIADLQRAQDELKKAKEANLTAESQHATDLAQNQDLTLKLREFVTRSVILSSVILSKEKMDKVFSGSKTEDRAQSYEARVAEFKGLTIDQLTIKAKELLDELVKTTIISTNMEALMGQGGDPELANKVKAHTDRKKTLTSWIRGQ